MPTPDDAPALPGVTVLLATHDGSRWLDEQLDSILDQDGVRVRVVVSDDGSTDGTPALLQARAAADPRITVLPSTTPTGRAAANFYRLLLDVDTGDDLVALSDQDDVWAPGKLSRHAALLSAGADAVSSNVLSFDGTGSTTLIRKNFPQRHWDHLLESPGPGSTFLLSPAVARLVRQVLRDVPEARLADYHDWLVYAVARSAGFRWTIDPTPTVRYRQHDHNAMGANVGIGSALARLRLIGNHWHRDQAALCARVGLAVVPDADRQDLQEMADLLGRRGLRTRIGLLRRTGHLRRRPRDRVVIGALIATGVW